MRLDLFGRDHIARVVLDRRRRLVARHEAGVETDHLERRRIGCAAVDVRESRLNVVEAQHIARALVGADADGAAAAVIPKDEDAMIGGKMLLAVAQEIFERTAAAQIGIAQILKTVQPILIAEVKVQRAVLKLVVLPAFRAARQDEHAHIGRQIDVRELPDVG